MAARLESLPGSDLFTARMLDRLPVGAYACDAEGLITWFNDAAVRIWGREPLCHDPSDRYCGSFALFDTEGVPLAHDRCWMALALKERRAYEGCEIQIGRPDGGRVHALAHASPIFDGAGGLLGAVNVLVDVTERRRAEQALHASERNLDDFFENAAVGLHWVDGDGIIVRANQAELDMLGYARDQYIGRHIADFHVDADVIEDILARLSAGETLYAREARLRHKDGSIRHVRISSSARFEDGALVRTRCFTLDVTEQKRAEAVLREADRRKNEFLAMLAHELRNPLAPIRNAVELLRIQSPPDPGLGEARDLIDRQVTQMSRLVDDLLDLARITRGKLTVRPERVELEAVVKSAIETARPLIDDRAHELIVRLPAESVPLDADPVRLAQVFLNLLANAARYTAPAGRIELAAELLASDAGRRVRVSVRDDGCGIPADELEGIFEMFARGRDAEAEGRDSGMGIGLTLVKSLVELHGGEVSARSEGPGRGSEFAVELPVASRGAARPARAHGLASGRRRRVLVVDDNLDGAVSLGMLLESSGHEVCLAHDGQQALQAAERFRPDAVLLDIGLPGMDGFETGQRLRAQPWGRDALLVAVTGWGDDEHKRRAREVGFDEHLVKPVSPQRVRDLLAQPRPAADPPGE